VDNKGNKQWVWLALDADTREIVGVYIGARFGSSSTQIVGILASCLSLLVRLHIRTFGQYMGQFSQANDIELSEKKQALTSYPHAI
jgi:IS1 family transposase